MAALIKTKEAHEKALRRIAELMESDPAPGTPKGEELELLAHLAETYEKKHFDIGLPDPISAIRFCMEQQGLTQNDLVRYLGTRSRVSEILGGKRTLTVPMIRKLSKGLGLPTEILVGKEEPESESPVVEAGLARRFPFTEMFKRGWIPFKGTLGEAKKRGDELIQRFCCFGLEMDALPALNRQQVRAGSDVDRFALLAWKTRVLCRANGVKFAKGFAPVKLEPGAFKHLVSLSVHEDGPVLAVEYLAGLGVPVIVEPQMPKTHLDGAAMRLPGGERPVIGLTVRFDRIDNFWFCLLHELGHAVLHIIPHKGECFLDDLDGKSATSQEKEADEFALDCTIRRDEWQRIWKSGDFSSETVRREARRLMIHPAILAGRIRKEKKDFSMLSNCVGNGMVRQLFPTEFTSAK